MSSAKAKFRNAIGKVRLKLQHSNITVVTTISESPSSISRQSSTSTSTFYDVFQELVYINQVQAIPKVINGSQLHDMILSQMRFENSLRSQSFFMTTNSDLSTALLEDDGEYSDVFFEPEVIPACDKNIEPKVTSNTAISRLPVGRTLSCGTSIVNDEKTNDKIRQDLYKRYGLEKWKVGTELPSNNPMAPPVHYRQSTCPRSPTMKSRFQSAGKQSAKRKFSPAVTKNYFP